MVLSRDVFIKFRVYVTVDESKFTEDSMEEFRKHFFPFYTIDDHIEHLGYNHIANHVDENSFIEGYGPAEDFGIKFSLISEGSWCDV
jgi:hypothetical protein